MAGHEISPRMAIGSTAGLGVVEGLDSPGRSIRRLNSSSSSGVASIHWKVGEDAAGA